MSLRTATIDIETRDGVADALLVAPDDGERHPGVLLYMDAFGPRPRLEQMAEHLAEQGYVVLVPHVFYRSGPAPLVDTSELTDPNARERVFARLRPLMADLTPERATSDAEAYLELLTSHEQVAEGPVGVVGYCMGGALALRTAAHRPQQVAAAAAFHPARLATDAEDSPHLLAPRLQAAVYVGSADDDPGMPPEQQQRLAEALAEAGVEHTCEQYDGAAHGFTMSDTAAYDEEATTRHWAALLDLFGRHLA